MKQIFKGTNKKQKYTTWGYTKHGYTNWLSKFLNNQTNEIVTNNKNKGDKNK